ncbi:hypothetical protein HPULCUR_000125 [Helicostylum pulchrum]|uniref:Uncharacterized protein n=1 Tax=Helicostylum pulchrum TaxID=562976 RepID=A0ABP9XJ28_9FUNG
MNDSDKERKIAVCNERIRYFGNKIAASTERPVLNSISEDVQTKSIDIQNQGNNDDYPSSDEEDSVEDFSRNVSRKQLKSLKGILKEVLFNSEKKIISATELQLQLSNLSNREDDVCLKIITFLRPYIPQKECFHMIIHQLPLVLLANDILIKTGNTSHTRKICPLSSLSQTSSLRVDGSSLYHIMTRADPISLDIFDYVGYTFQSEEDARRQQDAIFGSIFDIKKN